MMRRFLALIPLLFAAACSRSPLQQTFNRLDAAIAARPVTDAAFERQLDSLRERIGSAPSDSLRWEENWQYFELTRIWNTDTAIRYVGILDRTATDGEQAILSELARIRMLVSRAEESDAAARLEALDTAGFNTRRLWETFIIAGLDVYKDLSRRGIDTHRSDSLRAIWLRKAGDTPLGTRLKATQLTAEGHDDEAEPLFLACYSQPGMPRNEYPKTAFNLAALYNRQGKTEEQLLWLAESAIRDMQIHCRQERSLYELAQTLIDRHDYGRASRYIHVMMEDAVACNYYTRMADTGTALVEISDIVSETERSRRILLTTALLLISLLALVIGGLLTVYFNQARTLRQKNGTIESMNQYLQDANRIKDNYVSRYMVLCAHYIDEVDETRHQLRVAARKGGLDAVMSLLRKPSYSDSEYKNFCRIFDDTFMGIFPNFVDEVNRLMPDELKFEKQADNSLCTHLRILAAIRLGITSSKQIAQFLHCAPTTVYTYRTKTRKRSLCPSDEFEERIRKIGL